VERPTFLELLEVGSNLRCEGLFWRPRVLSCDSKGFVQVFDHRVHSHQHGLEVLPQREESLTILLSLGYGCLFLYIVINKDRKADFNDCFMGFLNGFPSTFCSGVCWFFFFSSSPSCVSLFSVESVCAFVWYFVISLFITSEA